MPNVVELELYFSGEDWEAGPIHHDHSASVLTSGALGFLGSNLGESCDIKSGEVQRIPTGYIY